MRDIQRPEIEILKSFEEGIDDIPERAAAQPQEPPLEVLIGIAEEAYRALDA